MNPAPTSDHKTTIRRRDFYLIPNVLTLSRVVAIPLVAGLAYFNYDLWAAIAFGLAGISDYVDGYIARKYNYESRLGMLLDPLADKLIVVSTMIVLLWLGRLNFIQTPHWSNIVPPILVIVTVGREIAITGLRSIASTIGITIAADKGGKLKTWIQFWAIVFLLLNFSPALEIGQALLSVSVILALVSGIQYTMRFIRGLPS
mgnify:CR=1 FL=1